MGLSSSESKATGHQEIPEHDKHHDDGYCNAWVEATAVGVCLLEVLGKLSSVRLNVGLVLRRLTACQLFLALSLSNEFIEFVLTLGRINMHSPESTGASGGE